MKVKTKLARFDGQTLYRAGSEMEINEKDFDSALYEKVEEEVVEAPKPKTTKKTSKK